MRMKQFERFLKKGESRLSRLMKRSRKKEKNEPQSRQVTQVMKVGGEGGDVEAGQDQEGVGRGQDAAGREVDTVTERREEDTGQEAQTERMESWRLVTGRRANGRKWRKSKISGDEGRRKGELNMKVSERKRKKDSSV